jgi:hypothetical protein
VGAVVLVTGVGLAARAEVNVVTDGTLVANAGNIALSRLVIAQRAITEDAKVDLRVTRQITNSFVDRGEAVSRVVLVGLLDARGAVVPVRARQALVAGADDTLEVVSMCSARRQIYGLGKKSIYLLTSITNGSVLELATGETARHDQVLQAEVAVRAKREGVGRVVAVLVAQQATKAKVVVLAVIASHQVALIDFCI